MNNEGNKKKFAELLLGTGRAGAQAVLESLDRLGFFEAPASCIFHLNHEGGLLEHSLNVCEMGLMLREQMVLRTPALAERLPVESVVIAGLLHDVCKADRYKTKYRNVRDEATGKWERMSQYYADYSPFPVGHGEKSVIELLKWGFSLTEDEILAIRWHMSAWDLPFQSDESSKSLTAAKAQCPLLTIIQCADSLSAGILEEI